MKCPLSSTNIDVGGECKHSKCWFWHKGAKRKCAVDDVGTSHIMTADVARIYGESVDETAARISRGRAKLAAWLALLDVLEEHKNAGCLKCGAPKCRDGKCADRVAKANALSSQLPLNEFVEMTPSRWYSAFNARASGNPTFSIKLQQIGN
jgi:hypothetical protein